MNKLKIISLIVLTPMFVSCAQDLEPVATTSGSSEYELNAPVDGTDGLTPETAADEPQVFPFADTQPYFFPPYPANLGISQTIYDRAKAYYNAHWKEFSNRRYVTLIDLGQHSGKKRFVVLDLKSGAFEKHNTAHGSGSDRNADGYVESFSNVSGSNKSSLGFYKTLYTYNGKNGRSLRLDGLESTNNNALARAVVVHGAAYVKDGPSTAGRSQGCPALDHAFAQSVIDKIRDGSMMLIASSRSL